MPGSPVQLDADDDIPDVPDDDLTAAVLASIGALAADGWNGNLAVIDSPADYTALGAAITHLAALGVDALLPSAELPDGAAIVADLNAAVLLRVVGGASVMVTDSHAEMFLENRARHPRRAAGRVRRVRSVGRAQRHHRGRDRPHRRHPRAAGTQRSRAPRPGAGQASAVRPRIT